MLTPAQTVALHDELAKHLDRIKRAFKPGSRVTLVIRNPGISDEAGVVIGDDDLDEAVAEIRRRQYPHGRCAACGSPNAADGCCGRSGCCNSD